MVAFYIALSYLRTSILSVFYDYLKPIIIVICVLYFLLPGSSSLKSLKFGKVFTLTVTVLSQDDATVKI